MARMSWRSRSGSDMEYVVPFLKHREHSSKSFVQRLKEQVVGPFVRMLRELPDMAATIPFV